MFYGAADCLIFSHSWPTLTSHRPRHLKPSDDTKVTFQRRSQTCAARNLYRHDQPSARDETGFPECTFARSPPTPPTTLRLALQFRFPSTALYIADIMLLDRTRRAVGGLPGPRRPSKPSARGRDANLSGRRLQLQRRTRGDDRLWGRTTWERSQIADGRSFPQLAALRTRTTRFHGPARGGAPYPYS